MKSTTSEPLHTVLIVEDDMLIAMAYQRKLRGLGFIVKHTADPKEAIQYLYFQNFDLVVLDLTLPGMDGLQLLEQMRAMPRHAQTPVVIFTSVDLSIARTSAQNLGVQYFYNKKRSPIDEVVATIQHLTAQNPTCATPTLRRAGVNFAEKTTKEAKIPEKIVDWDPFAQEPPRSKTTTAWENAINEPLG